MTRITHGGIKKDKARETQKKMQSGSLRNLMRSELPRGYLNKKSTFFFNEYQQVNIKQWID